VERAKDVAERWYDRDVFKRFTRSCGWTHYTGDPEVRLPYAESGFGDGVYRVFHLVQGRRHVGLEAIFIQRHEPYPLGKPAELALADLKGVASRIASRTRHEG